MKFHLALRRNHDSSTWFPSSRNTIRTSRRNRSFCAKQSGVSPPRDHRDGSVQTIQEVVLLW